MKDYNIPKTVIVADGSFPSHAIPLEYIRNAERIICCDGSTAYLLAAGFIPEAIVGDMDSLSEELAERFADRLFVDKNQDTNDLTKTVIWCREKGFTDIVIVGATGKREDHTLGNISLLADYSEFANVIMVTDTGILIPCIKSSNLDTFPGQQVSLFAIDPGTTITSDGLKYRLTDTRMKNWWVATLNEATGPVVTLNISGGPVIVYLKFEQ